MKLPLIALFSLLLAGAGHAQSPQRPALDTPAVDTTQVRVVFIKRADAPDTVLPDTTTLKACVATIEDWYNINDTTPRIDNPYVAIMCLHAPTGRVLRIARF